MMGLMFVNGVTPPPKLTMWFVQHHSFGNAFILKALDKLMKGRWWAIRGCWKHFRRFMCMFNFRENLRKAAAKNHLFKVQCLLDELNENASTMWIPGKWLAMEEQTLGSPC